MESKDFNPRIWLFTPAHLIYFVFVLIVLKVLLIYFPSRVGLFFIGGYLNQLFEFLRVGKLKSVYSWTTGIASFTLCTSLTYELLEWLF